MHYFEFSLQIPSTVTRILLNHFKWDKEKLMERYYDGDQERLFSEAHVVSPHRRQDTGARPKVYRVHLQYI